MLFGLKTLGCIALSSVLALKLIRKLLEKYWGSIDIRNEINVRNQVVVITGSNTGIGKVTARELASRGACVILACRDIVAAQNAIREIRQFTSSGQLDAMHLDLASFESIVQFSKNFTSKYSSLKILINNAGVYWPMNQRQKSANGYEIHFAVNHLGHFLLTNLLLNTLKNSVPSRVVTLTSLMHCGGRMNWDDIMYDAGDAGRETPVFHPLYANSKLANALFSKELSRRLEGSGINTYCLCPGLVDTEIARNMQFSWYLKLFSPIVNLLRKTPEQGCQTTLYCALSKDLCFESGQMYRNCSIWPQSSRKSLPDADAKKLWKLSETLTNLQEKLKNL